MHDDEPIADWIARLNAQTDQVAAAVQTLAQLVGGYRVALFNVGIQDDLLEEFVGEFHSMLLGHMFVPDAEGD